MACIIVVLSHIKFKVGTVTIVITVERIPQYKLLYRLVYYNANNIITDNTIMVFTGFLSLLLIPP